MTKIVDRVHTDAAEIERLKSLQQALDAELVAELHLRDGRVLVGTVVERPAVLQMVDAAGTEGTNGLLRFDLGDGGVHLLALDEVDHIVRVGSK
ncbi:DUF3247 family protein [Xanthomonas sp. 60]